MGRGDVCVRALKDRAARPGRGDKTLGTEGG